MKGRTVITIAHRLEAVRNAEFCIVLDKGRMVRHGRAEDILRENSNNLSSMIDEE
jgi:ABC-type multidrug transport system fused ATPase/permease subunit